MRFSTVATVAVAVAAASPALAYPLTARATEGEVAPHKFDNGEQGTGLQGPTHAGQNTVKHYHKHAHKHAQHAHPQGAGALAARDLDLDELYERDLDLEELYARDLDLEELYARDGEAETRSAQGVQSAGPPGGHRGLVHGPNHGKHAHPQGAGALAARDLELDELYERDLDLEELYARDGEAETGSAQGVQSAGPSGRPGHVRGPNHGKHATHQHGPNHSKHAHPQGAGALAARDFELEELYARDGGEVGPGLHRSNAVYKQRYRSVRHGLRDLEEILARSFYDELD